MSYDLTIHVKAEGCDAYPTIAEPEYPDPTYNLGKMFRACMDWDYEQSAQGEDGVWRTVYYTCDFVLPKVEHGIRELRLNREAYEQFEPENGWGNIESAIRALESLRTCIYEQSERIPLKCLYMAW